MFNGYMLVPSCPIVIELQQKLGCVYCSVISLDNRARAYFLAIHSASGTNS